MKPRRWTELVQRNPPLEGWLLGWGGDFYTWLGSYVSVFAAKDDKGGSSWSFKIRFSSEMCCEENQAKSEDTDRKTSIPVAPGLVKANLVKRVDSVEKADLCYWDAQDGDRLDHWLEAPWGVMGCHGVPWGAMGGGWICSCSTVVGLEQ